MTGTSESVSLTPDENRSQYWVPALWAGRLEAEIPKQDAPSGHHAEDFPGIIYCLEASCQPLGSGAVTEEKTEAQRGQATSWRSHSEKWHCRCGPHDSRISKHPVPRGEGGWVVHRPPSSSKGSKSSQQEHGGQF